MEGKRPKKGGRGSKKFVKFPYYLNFPFKIKSKEKMSNVIKIKTNDKFIYLRRNMVGRTT